MPASFMGKEIIVNTENEQTRIAIVENGDLVELFIENPEHERTLGDLYLARVRKIMPSIQAAFVDIGQKQDAFLHFSDLSDNLPELLGYLQDTNPEVGKAMAHSERHRQAGQRRHPRHAPVPSSKQEEGEQEEGEPAEVAAGEGEGNKPDPRRNARTRGQRRSAQHRSRQKSDDVVRPDEDDDEDERPAPPRQPLESYLKRDQRILVKIVKEPISTKGSRVSTDISLAGRFLVLVPLADYVAVSKKIISYKERRRLRTLAKSLLPEGFGVIVRTVAEGKNAKALDTDLRLLVEKWRKIERKLQGKPEPPMKVHDDVNMVSSIMRDLFTDDYDRILVDDPRVHRNIKSYVQAVAPQMAPAVQLYKGQEPVFAHAKIARDAAQAFESRVDLPSGGYLFIERTEAMYVVDVNSGRSGRGMTQEENSLRVNMEAARVITRQIRLRDIGGIIVVDFIDLRDDRNKQKVYDELKKEFRKDRAVTKILPMSDFGLIQITRQRLRPSITITFAGPNGSATPDLPKKAADADSDVKQEPPRREQRP
ncbi:MAG TPA: Rne/Rng family ribonuclease, partial [Rhodothermales bacterium]|nr:Rne/Rng family ribonuclease [Rhodothermales bacterium]